MDTLVKFTSISQGKDRVFAAAQFACALCTHLLRSKPQRKQLVDKLKIVEANISAGRKLCVTCTNTTVTICQASLKEPVIACTWPHEGGELSSPAYQDEAPAPSCQSNMSTSESIKRMGSFFQRDRMLKLGNAVNCVQAAKRSMLLSDRVLCLCLTAANINRALSLICDNVLWARSVGLICDINQESWRRISSRCYLLSVILNVTRDAYLVLQLMTQKAKDKDFRQRMSRHLHESPEVAEVVIPQLDALLFLLFESLKSHPAVALDTLKNVCDLCSPLDRLGFYQSNAGVVAFCGLISSLIGIVTIAKPSLNIKT